MGSTFIALPLSSGEAFLLRTTDEAGREWAILVDGGKKYGEGSRELAKLLAQVSPTIERIDIIVCTHSDSDHSQGLWYFADDWYGMGRSIGEFWLPGRWANAMPMILTDPARFVARLEEGAREVARRLSESDQPKFDGEGRSASIVSRELRYRALSERLAEVDDDLIASAVRPLERDEGAIEDLASAFGLTAGELGLLRADLQETDNEVDLFATAMTHAITPQNSLIIAGEERIWLTRSSPTLLEARTVFAEVAETAEAIRKIATAAVERRIRVRWFDFGEYAKTERPSGGVKGVFEPLCSVEVVPDRAKLIRLSALALVTSLRLTRQNVESIVFYRPETTGAPGALFLGDSRLAHGIERPEKDFPIPFPKPAGKLLVTTPHHGSDNNDHAYGVLDKWLGESNFLLVRNGGQSNQRLDEYVTRSDRRCAQCVQCHGKDWHQWVAVTSSESGWNWPPSANVCGTPRT